MSDQSYIGETLDDFGRFVAHLRTDQEASKRAMRRTIAAVAVALLHVVFVILLLWAEMIPGLRLRPSQEPPLLWLLLPRPAGVQTPVQHQGKESEHTPQVTYVPPPVTPPEQSTAINPAYALGQALACGASSYEYLTPEGRKQCKHAPWAYKYDKYDKNGTIVLDAAPRVVQEKPRISDIQAHERNTAPNCPKYIDPNAPCLYDIIHGKQ